MVYYTFYTKAFFQFFFNNAFDFSFKLNSMPFLLISSLLSLNDGKLLNVRFS